MKISYKWASYTLGTLFLLFGIFIFAETLSFPDIPGTVMGSEYLPRILSTLIALTAILSIILTALKKEDQHFEIKYPLFLLGFISLVILFTILIKFFNYYVVLLGFFIACFGLLNRETPRRKAWIKSLLVALLLTAIVYLTIGRILGVFI